MNTIFDNKALEVLKIQLRDIVSSLLKPESQIQLTQHKPNRMLSRSVC